MPYVESNLIPGESVAYRARLHWIVVLPIVAGGSALDLTGMILFVVALLGKHPHHPSLLMIVLAILLMAAGSGLTAYAILRRNATEIAVTSRRVLIKTGMLSRRSTEVLLTKVESVRIEESMLGRVVGYGKVTIHGTGGTPETFERISRPHEFRRQVQGQIEKLPASGMARTG